jgi:hypothetical protein
LEVLAWIPDSAPASTSKKGNLGGFDRKFETTKVLGLYIEESVGLRGIAYAISFAETDYLEEK